MADTFRQMYRELREYVPNLPEFLARKLINERYQRILDTRPWAGLRGQDQWLIPNMYTTGTIDVVNGSATMVGHGTAWTADMVGRQIRPNNQAPTFTILDVIDDHTLTVDSVWGMRTQLNIPYLIVQCYVSAPTDFKEFKVVYDPIRMWRLFTWIKVEELAQYDPARTNTGDAWIVADYLYDGQGTPQFELWPAPTTIRTYPYVYVKQGTPLINADDTPIYPLRGNEIVLGALADLCRWPGTPATPNPLFEKAQIMLPQYEGQCRDALIQLERIDEGIYLNWWGKGDYMTYPYAPFDDKFLQNHAFAQ